MKAQIVGKGSTALDHWLLDTHPQSPVVNSQAAGIGRLSSMDGLLILNNLGRNIEVCREHNGILEPVAFFHQTIFPGQDDPSQFDLDMHAFFRTTDGAYLAAINHYGLVRFFDWPSPANLTNPQQLNLAFCLQWPGDTERAILVDQCLISSSPSGYEVSDPAQPGLLISEPWNNHATPATPNHPSKWPYSVVLADWDTINHIAIDPSGCRLLVAAGNRGACFELLRQGKSLQLGSTIFEFETAFRIGWAEFTANSRYLIVAGYGLTSASEQEWDKLGDGGYLVLDYEYRQPVAGGILGCDLAWGNGSVPLVLHDNLLFGVDRAAALYSWRLRNKERSTLVVPPSHVGASLGMAHFACSGSTLLCGFNRGGYKLHRYAQW